MKKPLLSLLLCAYSVILFKPVIPVAADFLAHTFWYSQHMATVHVVNGKYHIHYDLYKSTKGNTSETDKSTNQNNQPLSDHLISIIDWSFDAFNERPNQQTQLFTSSLHEGISAITYKPPRIS